ncbi:hypothetical protein SAMN05428944_0931 [Streptomyces sp. 1222.5]|uniref:hypothetical protein n=1 Tax=unclassified Streptomyces TaxID=2593676 RepID=UPI000895435A|nr:MULTISPECIES: hypothetical protein [unclassified Streptomyces]PKW11835.1 hypothetical protein BX260_7162 [Streptomyces sp. 5112.2]SEB68854.1 hypothetical protein SAMN05428944_0931 [Streptomyces sp. 1222.5]
MRRRLARAAAKVCLALATLGLVVPSTTATAAPAAQTFHQQTVVLPLSGTFRTLGSEAIDVTGSLRVKVVTDTAQGGGGTAHVTSTMLRTTGVGQVSGGTYRFVGSDHNVVTFPPGPIAPLTFHPTFFNVYPPGPIIPTVPPHPIQPVILRVALAQDGAINGISATIDPGTTDN